MTTQQEHADRIIAQRREFAYFEEGNVELFRKRALGGTLRDSLVRSVAWKVFLSALSNSPAQWADEALKWRSIYSTHVSEHWVDPHSVAQPDDDPTVNNPLSQAHDSTWNKFFKNRELQHEIQKDLDRLFPEYDFFQEKIPQSQMMKVLFVWSKTHPNTSYRQGMHELLAPILWLTSKESIIVASDFNGRDLFQGILDSRYIEHDSFALFSKLMEQMEGLFEHNTNAQKQSAQPTPDTERSLYTGPAAGALAGAATSTAAPAPPPVTPIIRKCNRIFSSLLKSRDPDVYKQLTALDIEPQFFLLRWLRCLFGREFHLEDVMVLWDAIFADSPTLVLSDFICVAMLKFVRSELIGKDQSSCLRRLMKYPPVEDVYSFVDHALRLRTPSHVSHTARSVPFTPLADDKSPEAFYGQAKKTIVSALKNPQKRFVTANSKGDHAQHHQQNTPSPRDPCRRLATKMASLIDLLEKASTDSESFQATQVLVAIAQLKQVRDILNGVLSIDTLDLLDALETQELAAANNQEIKATQLVRSATDNDNNTSNNNDPGTEDLVDYDKCSLDDTDSRPTTPPPLTTITTTSVANDNVPINTDSISSALLYPRSQSPDPLAGTSIGSGVGIGTGAVGGVADAPELASVPVRPTLLPWEDSAQASIIQDMTSSSASLQPPILKPPDRKDAKKKITLQETGLLDLFDPSSSDSFLSTKKSDSLFGSSSSASRQKRPMQQTTTTAAVAASLFDEIEDSAKSDDGIFGFVPKVVVGKSAALWNDDDGNNNAGSNDNNNNASNQAKDVVTASTTTTRTTITTTTTTTTAAPATTSASVIEGLFSVDSTRDDLFS